MLVRLLEAGLGVGCLLLIVRLLISLLGVEVRLGLSIQVRAAVRAYGSAFGVGGSASGAIHGNPFLGFALLISLESLYHTAALRLGATWEGFAIKPPRELYYLPN